MSASTRVDFNASLDGETLSWQRADRGFGNLEMRFGYTFAPKDWMVSPFLGIGTYDIYAVDHHNHQGFREELPFATAGAKTVYAGSEQFRVGLDWKVFCTFSAEQRFKFDDGERKTHRNTWGGEIGLPLVWRIGSSQLWDVQLEPYFLKLAFPQTQNVYGTRLLFGYRF